MALPEHYGCVILANAVLPFCCSMYMGGKVMAARKLYDVKYPNLVSVGRPRTMMEQPACPKAFVCCAALQF